MFSIVFSVIGCESGSTPAPAGTDDVKIVADSSTGNDILNDSDGSDSLDGSVDGSLDGTVNPDGDDGSTDSDVDGSDSLDSSDGVDGTTYPEPGTVEYWKQIIPGKWEMTPCTSLDTKNCSLELEVIGVELLSPVGDVKKICPETAYIVHTTNDTSFWTTSALCLNDESSVAICNVPGQPDSECFDIFFSTISGTLNENVISTGICSGGKADGVRSCSRQSDCVDLQGSACSNLSVEYWLTIKNGADQTANYKKIE